mgnify:CR=1 FL=1
MAAGDLRSYFRLLRHNPAFTRFWLAGVISHIGNWFNYIGIFVLLSSHTGSGQAVSWFLIAKFLPAFLWGPMAGVVADRLPRKMIMIAGDLIRAVLVLGYLFVDSADYLWLVYVLALSQETVWSFTDPARRASVPNLCAKEELKVANSLSGATWSVMLAVGAALGGFVTALFGWQTAILVDAATFILSAAILTTLPLPHQRRAKPAITSWSSLIGLTDLQEGWRYILQRKETMRLILVKSGWAMAGGIMVMLTVFGEQVFGGENGGKSGILYSARGIGAALGPVTAWKLFGEERPEMIRAIGFGFFMAAASYLCFSQSPSLIPAAFFVFFAHLGGSVQWVFSTTILQETVPDSFRGRVFAAEMGLLTLVLSISTWLTGFILDLGADPRLVTAGLAACFLLPGLAWSMTAILPAGAANAQSKKQ